MTVVRAVAVVGGARVRGSKDLIAERAIVEDVPLSLARVDLALDSVADLVRRVVGVVHAFDGVIDDAVGGLALNGCVLKF